ncbi:MAG: NUDIX domain-containing protein [bacterium]|nr:NUDIX domain-containing protein [bacterium]
MTLNDKPITPFSLIYLVVDDKVLLIKRLPSKKLLGSKIIGLGGKVEPGEDILTSAKREFKEETGLDILNPVFKGTYTWVDTNFIGTSHIIVGTEYNGELIDSNEGELGWYNIDSLKDLEGLAKYQHNFLPDVFENGFHYTGLAFFNGDELLSYTDAKPYFATLSKTNH